MKKSKIVDRKVKEIKMSKDELFTLYQYLVKFLIVSPLKKDKEEIKKMVFKVDGLIWDRKSKKQHGKKQKK